jgi:hypothetical protein
VRFPGSEVSSNPKKKKTYSNISNDTLKKIKNLKPNIMAAATIVKKKKILEGSNKKREIMKET